jgi:hypothetical protein
MLKAIGKTILVTVKFKKMETTKMSLANIQGKLSRAEMKNIMAGSGACPYGHLSCSTNTDCGNINAGVCCGSGCCWQVCTS